MHFELSVQTFEVMVWVWIAQLSAGLLHSAAPQDLVTFLFISIRLSQCVSVLTGVALCPRVHVGISTRRVRTSHGQ